MTASTIAHLGSLGLSETDLARATGVGPSSAHDWLLGSSTPTGPAAARVTELVTAVERLELLIKRDYIAEWLRSPVPALDGDGPLDVIGAGDYRRLARVISGLESPGAV